MCLTLSHGVGILYVHVHVTLGFVVVHVLQDCGNAGFRFLKFSSVK